MLVSSDSPVGVCRRGNESITRTKRVEELRTSTLPSISASIFSRSVAEMVGGALCPVYKLLAELGHACVPPNAARKQMSEKVKRERRRSLKTRSQLIFDDRDAEIAATSLPPRPKTSMGGMLHSARCRTQLNFSQLHAKFSVLQSFLPALLACRSVCKF